MRLFDLVEQSQVVAATRSRKKKIALLSGLLADADPDTLAIAVGLLSGAPRQGKVGVGYAGAFKVDVAPATAPSLTVAQLDAALDGLARVEGEGAQSRRQDALEALFARATAPEQAYVRALLTGELRQGALEGLMVEALAEARSVSVDLVRRAVMLTGDLTRTATIAAEGGEAALRAVSLTVMVPVRPMLAAPAASPEEAVDGEVAIDFKLDGARVQVHRHGDEVRVFTRNLNDITARMPETVRAVRALDVDSVILDGEAMVIRDDGRPESFQNTMRQFGSESRALESAPLTPFFFDVLEHDGEALIDLPLSARLEHLDRIVPETHRIARLHTNDPAEVPALMEQSLKAGHEGLLVKRLDSPYEAGRRGSAWRKLKPVYTFDLVVLAVDWGSGRRKGKLSNIHLGARDVSNQADGAPNFVMVGKTFKGMTDDMLAWQTERFLELETRRTKQTVYVRPEQVVEVAIDGVLESPRYPGGVALRFARVRRYRDDKAPHEADTLQALQSMLK